MKLVPITFLICLFHVHVFSQIDLNAPFKAREIEGSITIYDLKSNKWLMSNALDSQLPTLPASTFKILNTLILLETGVVKNENEIIKWPGKTDTTKYGFRPEIYHDMNLKEAFKTSAGWVYIELAKKIEQEKYKEFLKNSNYGNTDNSIEDPDFWNFGKLAISPINQIEILKGVYNETLPFSHNAFQILKEIMVEEETNNYTLRAKTGWTRVNELDIGWWVGYVTTIDNVYFFATRIIKERSTINPRFGTFRKYITKEVLRQLNILP